MIIESNKSLIKYLAGMVNTMPKMFDRNGIGKSILEAYEYNTPLVIDLPVDQLEKLKEVLFRMNHSFTSGALDKAKCIIGGVDLIKKYKKETMPHMMRLIRGLENEITLKSN